MSDIVSTRKNKISLSDYDCPSDLKNRLIMAEFTTLDLLVLEEILYSALKISVRKLAKSLEVDEHKVLPILEKFSKSGLLTVQGDEITVDKEMRKYYESQVLKFDQEFTPGMEFLQGLLRKVPIQVLPTWYSIPRTSNNIFDSLVEKYLLTPQIFQRYLMEFQLGDSVLSGMAKAVYSSPDFKVFGSELMEKFGLSREQFEENMLYLEFNFICCLNYEKIEDEWKEVVTPFAEWRDYLCFLRDTEVSSLPSNAKIEPTSGTDFTYIENLSTLLSCMKQQPTPCNETGKLDKKATQAVLSKCPGIQADELDDLIAKLRLLKLADIVDKRLYALETANDWLDMSIENRAIFIYRHPLNRLSSENIPSQLCNDRTIREAEKSIARVIGKGWVYFDEFIKGVIVPLSENSLIMLKKTGKTWKYTVPEYTEEEKLLIKATLFNWLPEVGVVNTGIHDGRECFCVTRFGDSIFGAR